MRQHANKQMMTGQRRYKGGQDKNNRNAPKEWHSGQYVYIDRPLMKTSAAVKLATDTYSTLMSPKLAYSESSKFRCVK